MVHTLDIAPLRSGSPPQKRSGMARVLKGSHNFTCTHSALGVSAIMRYINRRFTYLLTYLLARSSTVEMRHICLSSYNWYSFTDPGGMEG